MPDDKFFALGDLLSNVLVGLVAAWLCQMCFGAGWGMWTAMFLGMALGMLTSLFLFTPLSHYFGAMEIMVPTMQTGMWVGMVVSMRASMVPLLAVDALIYGVFIAVLVTLIMWLLNTQMQGMSHE